MLTEYLPGTFGPVVQTVKVDFDSGPVDVPVPVQHDDAAATVIKASKMIVDSVTKLDNFDTSIDAPII